MLLFHSLCHSGAVFWHTSTLFSLQWTDHGHSSRCPGRLDSLLGFVFPGLAVPPRSSHTPQESHEKVPPKWRGETSDIIQTQEPQGVLFLREKKNYLTNIIIFLAELWAAGAWRERHQGSRPHPEALRAQENQSNWLGCFWHAEQSISPLSLF